MESTPAEYTGRLAAVRYRDLLSAPGVARAHDIQRVLSYGLGVTIGLIVDVPQWRATFVLVVSSWMLAAAVWRLATRRTIPPYPLALVDLFASGLIVAVLTGSILVTLAVVGVVTLAIAASFDAPRRYAASSTAAALVLPLGIAWAIGGREGPAPDDLIALVLIVLLLSLAFVILVFFTIQARRLRRNLSSSEALLTSVLAVTPVVLATVDDDGTITAMAGDVERWLGLPGDRLDGSSELAEVVAAASRGDRVIRDIAVGHRVFSVTCDLRPDGTSVLTAYDITERAEARRRREGLVRAKDQFIAAVSHELRTPLAAVLGFAEEVHDSMSADDALQPMVGVIADQSAEMAAIIEDLLVVARSSFEDVPMAPKRIDLGGEAATVISTIGSRLDKQVETRLENVETLADPIRVRQIIRNQLTNADRYGGAW